MKDANQMCVLCNEAITNPICVDCLGKSMEQWALNMKPEIAKELAEKVGLFRSYTHKGTTCVVCRKNNNICAHCLCSEINNWLMEEHPELTESFLVCFNYEIKSNCVY